MTGQERLLSTQEWKDHVDCEVGVYADIVQCKSCTRGREQVEITSETFLRGRCRLVCCEEAIMMIMYSCETEEAVEE